jgi:hypothetical protein
MQRSWIAWLVLVIALSTNNGISAGGERVRITIDPEFAKLEAAPDADGDPRDKLSPDLRAAVEAEATFLGTTQDGAAVLELEEEMAVRDARDTLERLDGVKDVEYLEDDLFDQIDELIVFVSKGEVDLAGVEVEKKHPAAEFVVVRAEGGGRRRPVHRA